MSQLPRAVVAPSRLRVGREVPWVTSWSAEEVLGVAPCPTVDGHLALHQAERPGLGKPNYSLNHMNRQRRTVREFLCPMCGKPTRPDDRWTQTATPTTAGELRARGLGHLLPRQVRLPDRQPILNAGAIAPSHRMCAELALTHCPHLGGMEDKTLKRFPARWAIAPLLVEASLPPPMDGPPVAVVSFLQLLGLS